MIYKRNTSLIIREEMILSVKFLTISVFLLQMIEFNVFLVSANVHHGGVEERYFTDIGDIKRTFG